MKRSQLLMITISFLSLFLFSTTAVKANEIPFQVAPIIPGDQTDNKGYFEFEVADGFTKTFSIRAQNLKSSPITLLITPINASTSAYGQISYNVNATSENFVNLKIPLSQVLTYEEKVTIPANSTVDIPFQLLLNEVENGTVLGGIHIIAENETVNQNNVKQGNTTFQIKNQIAYVIGVKLKTAQIVEPKFSFDSVKVDIQYRRPKIFIAMKNSAPASLKDLSGTYVVTDEDGNQVLEGSFSDLQMAPNTRFQYAIDWTEGEVTAGKYKIKLSAEADGKKVTTQKNFVIKENDNIKDYNHKVEEGAMQTDEEVDFNFPWWSYLITAAIAGIFFFLLGRKFGRKKEK